MDSSREERLEAKVDHVIDKIENINVTLAAQHESLKDHIRRTELLEEEVKPLLKHDHMAMGILKLFGFLALIGTITEGAIALLNYIRH